MISKQQRDTGQTRTTKIEVMAWLLIGNEDEEREISIYRL